MLKKIIFVRHGDHDGYHLTPRGRAEMELLGALLVPVVRGLQISVLSSKKTMVTESAAILGRCLGEPKVEEHECLYPKGGFVSHAEQEESLRLLDHVGQKSEVVIVVSHGQLVDSLPRPWGKTKQLDVSEGFIIGNGGARIIDMATGKLRVIEP